MVRALYNGSPAWVGASCSHRCSPPALGAGVTAALASRRGRRAAPRARPCGRGRVLPGSRQGSHGRPQGSPNRPRAAGLAPDPRPPPPGARQSPEADINGQRGRRGELAAPGAPLRPEPASVSRSLTLLAGGSGRGGSAAARGRPLAPGELGARRRQPAPAPAPLPRPRARCPQSLRPARGRTLAEHGRSGPGCASPASTCPTSGASA